MKKKSKGTLNKVFTVIVLVALLGSLLAGYLILKERNAEVDMPEEEVDTSFEIFNKGKAIVTKIHFKTKDEDLSFSYVNEDWVYDGDNKFPLDQDGVASMAAAIGKIKASFKLDKPSDDISDYGLKEPLITVDAVFSDDSTRSFYFGDTNSFNNCVYFMLSGDDSIYLVESDVATAFGVDLDYLYEPEDYTLRKDSVTDDEVTSIIISTNGKEKEITDAEGIAELFELVYTLDLSDYEDYYADSSQMLYDYGIGPDSEKITVKYTLTTTENNKAVKVPKEYTVYIGFKYENAKTDSEDTDSTDTTTAADETSTHSYFYTFEGSSVVYTADGKTVDEIFEFLAYEPKTEETTAAQ